MHRLPRPIAASLLLSGVTCLASAQPQDENSELTADGPIVFDDARNLIVATDNARLRSGPALLIADRIEFDRNASIARAIGNVSLTGGAFRALADSLILNLKSGDLTATNYRMGFDPIVAEGVSAERKNGIVHLEDVRLHFRDKRPGEPNLQLKEAELKPEKGSFAARGVGLRVGNFTLAKIPRLKGNTRESLFEGKLSLGEDDRLGWRLEVGSLFRPTPELAFGGSVAGYTKRGVLFSPEANYLHLYDGGYSKGSLLGGFISDEGDDPGLDLRGDPVPRERGFADLEHLQRFEDNLRLALQLEWRNDSETFRDFRRDLFAEHQWNDSFAEVAYEGNHFGLTLFSRLHANEYETVVERRPEFSLDVPPIEWLAPELYHSISFAYSNLRVADPTSNPDLEAGRFDLAHGIRRPFRLTPWLTLSPLASHRFVKYHQTEGNPDRHFGEVGTDLRLRLGADFDVQSETWEINGLRHDLALVLAHRHLERLDSEGDGALPALDTAFLDPNLRPLDLFDLRQTDSIAERRLFRLGLENHLLTRTPDGTSRTLASLHLYQDLLPKQEPGQHLFDELYLDLLLAPADWLALDARSKLDARTGKVDRIALSLRLRDGDLGELDLSYFDYRSFSEQYQLVAKRRFTERRTAYAGLRFDAQDSRFTHIFLGLSQRIGDSWNLLYSITRRRGALKEDSTQFDAGLRLFSF